MTGDDLEDGPVRLATTCPEAPVTMVTEKGETKLPLTFPAARLTAVYASETGRTRVMLWRDWPDGPAGRELLGIYDC